MSVTKTVRTLDTVHLIGSLLSIGIILGVGIVPLTDTLDLRLQRLFAVLLATLVLWITQPIPYSISSILAVVLLFALGVTDTFSAAVSGFASTLVFFVILLLLLGKSISKVNLDDWIANRLVSATSTPKSSTRRLSISLYLLALIMPSGTARTVAFMPIIDQINDLYDLDDGSRFRRFGYYMIGHVNVVGSAALMTGGGMSLVTAELINLHVRPITWFEWAMYMILPVGCIFMLTALVSSQFYSVDDRVLVTDSTTSESSRDLEPLTGEQWLVLSTLFLAILFWIIGSFLGVPAIIPAMFVVLVFSIPGIGILTATDFNDISWGVVFLIGAMLSILEVKEELGGFDIVIDILFSGLPVGLPVAGLVAILLGFSLLVRMIFSSVAAALLILIPVLVEFASATPVNEFYLSLSLLLLLVSCAVLPFQVSTTLLAYEYGPLTMREVFLFGVLTLTAAVMTVAVSWIVFWPLVDVTVDIVF